MANPLLTGISGLRGHQKMLEVIGNNLANVNTTAYKTSRTLFSDLQYEAQRGALSGTGGLLGSVNPIEVGTGSKVSSVDRNHNQGNLEDTGEQLDVAIDGRGFFVANNGRSQVYTRAGAFSLDENGYLEDPSTGYLLQRFGTVGESNTQGPSFQTSGDSRILIPIGANIPGNPTQNVEISGRLGANSTGPTQRLLRGATLESGGAPATGATLLNALDSVSPAYAAGDRMILTGQLADGTAYSSNFSVDGTTTVQNLIDHIQTVFGADATISLVNSGIEVQATAYGQNAVTLRIEDDPANTGFSSAEFTAAYNIEDPGQEASVISGTIRVYDESGAEHELQYSLEKQIDSSWTITFDMDSSSGTLTDGLIEGITFGTDGSLTQITGNGLGDGNIAILFAGASVPLTIDVGLGSPGDFDGLSEIGAFPEIAANADGYGPGELAQVQIDASGTISGIGSNGIKFTVAQLAIASFRNPDGLTTAGNNYFEASLASGTPQVGTGFSGDRGLIRAGQLEGSNVDLALEFTRLLVAQRGFSANARTITVTDEILEELTNIIR